MQVFLTGYINEIICSKLYLLRGSSSRPGLGEQSSVPPSVPPPGLEPKPVPESFPLPPCFEPVPVDFPLGSGTTTSLSLEITTQMGLRPATDYNVKSLSDNAFRGFPRGGSIVFSIFYSSL